MRAAWIAMPVWAATWPSRSTSSWQNCWAALDVHHAVVRALVERGRAHAGADRVVAAVGARQGVGVAEQHAAAIGHHVGDDRAGHLELAAEVAGAGALALDPNAGACILDQDADAVGLGVS
ncbi:MAG: hypothetical protein R2939_18090 [Kofleriaceae bacterium]